MPEELQGISVRLELDTSQMAQGSEQGNRALDAMTQSTEKATKSTDGLQDGLNRVGDAAQKAAAKQAGAASSATLTQAQYDKMAKAVEAYKQKLIELGNEEAALQAKIAAAQRSVSAQLQDNPRYDKGLAEMTAGLPELRKQLEANIDEQVRYSEAVEQSGVAMEGFTAQAQGAEQGGEKTSRMLVNMGAAAAASAADMAGQTGLANAIRAVGSSISALMLATGPTGIAIAAVTVGMNAIGMIMQSVKSNAAQAREQIEAVKQAAQDMRATVATMQDIKINLATLESATSTLDEQARARAAIVSLFPDMIVGYTQEGEAILAANEILERRLQLMREEEAEKRKAATTSANHLLGSQINIATASVEEYVSAAQHAVDTDKMLKEQLGKPTLSGSGAAYGAGLTIKTDEQLEKMLQDGKEAFESLEKTAVIAISGIQTEFDSLSPEQLIAVNSAAAKSEIELHDALVQIREELTNGEITGAEAAARIAEAIETSKQAVRDALGDVEALAAAYESYYSATSGASEGTERLTRALQTAQAAADAAKWQKYFDTIRTGAKSTNEYKNALSEVAKRFKVTEDAVEGNVELYAKMAGKLDESAVAEYNLAIAAIDASIAEQQAALAAAGVSDGAYNDILKDVAALEEVRKVMGDIVASLGGGPTGKSTGGGGGGSRKQAWEDELAIMESAKAGVEDLGATYATVLQNMLDGQQLSADGRKRVEKEMQYALEGIDGTMQEDYIAYLEGILRSQKLNADKRLEVEKKLLDAQKELYRQQLQALDELGNAVIDALKNKYEKQRDAQQAALDESASAYKASMDSEIAAARAAADARIAALREEIAALDELKRARKEARQEADDQRKLDILKKQLSLEKESYDQIRLQEQIARHEQDMADRAEDARIEKEKAGKQDEIKTIQGQLDITISSLQAMAQAEEESLANRKKANDDYWEKRLSDEVLMGEALYILQNDSQDAILELLQTYNPEYLQQGQQMGQMLYNGFNEKYDMLLKRTKAVAGDIIAQANAAMSAWQRMQSVINGGGNNTSGPGSSPTTSGTSFANMYSMASASADRFTMAAVDSLEQMVEAPRAYAAQKAAQAAANGAETYSLADSSTATGAYGTAARGKILHIGSLTQVIQAPSQSAYEQQREARAGIEDLMRRGLV